MQHPHIVPLYAAGEHGELLYYTMPYIEGESLKHALHGGKATRFSPKDVLRVLHDVVDALCYAHERGVIHRDIKPGNVLRSGNHAVVTDFGVAKAISAAMPQVGMTASGMAIGTPAYMAKDLEEMDKAPRRRGGFEMSFGTGGPGGPPGSATSATSGVGNRQASAEDMIALSRRLDAIAKEPPRRVAIWTHPPDNQHPEIVSAGTSITDLLRKVLGGNRRYVPIDRDSTVDVLLKSRDRNEVTRQLKPDMMVTIRGNPVGRDSVIWTTTVWDLTAVQSYTQRAVSAGVVSSKTPMINADSLLRVTLTTMSTLDRAVRR